MNALSKDGTTRVRLLQHSQDNKYIATITRKAGSDWAEINVMEVATAKKLPDEVKWVKNTGLDWLGNGFFYSNYPAPSSGTTLSHKNVNHRIYFHRLGTTQAQDELIYEDKNPLSFNRAALTEDKRFLFIASFSGNNNTNIYCKDFTSTDTTIKLLVKGIDNEENEIVTDDVDGKIFLMTNHNAPNNKLVLVDPKDPSPSNWKTIIDEKPYLLANVDAVGGKLITTYLKDVTSRCYQYTYSGILQNEIKLPALGTISGFRGEEKDTIAFYTFSSFTYPYTIFKYNINNGASEIYNKLTMKNNPANYEVKQIFYTSKDATKIPMFLVYKKD